MRLPRVAPGGHRADCRTGDPARSDPGSCHGVHCVVLWRGCARDSPVACVASSREGACRLAIHDPAGYWEPFLAACNDTRTTVFMHIGSGSHWITSSPDDTMRSLHELFQTCNAARYAPTRSSQELSALIPKLESVLHPLQQLKA